MTKYLQQRVLPLLEGKSFRSDDELYVYLMSMLAAGLAAIVHIILAVIFLFAHVPVMLFLTLGSLLLDASCFFIVGKRRYRLSGFIITISVSCYTLVSVWLLGARSYAVFYLPAVLLMQVTIPYAGRTARGVIFCFLYLTFCVSVSADFWHAAVLDLGKLHLLLALTNMNVGFVGTVAQLLLTNCIRTTIAQYNARRLESYKTQANTDPLTGLYNRRYADVAFDRIKREQPEGWCVAMMDIDDFKHINDRYGHNTGDVVLRVLAETMRATLRKSDILVRWGGEEFLLLLSDVDLATASAILDMLRSTISSTQIISEGVVVSVTVTIGVAALDSGDVEGSIGRCDHMLYEGKKQGKNKVSAV